MSLRLSLEHLRRHLSGMFFCGVLLATTQAVADDAYDDEAEEIEPEGLSDEQDQSAEKIGNGLSAGGLAAPEAMPETGDRRNDVEKSLDEADEKDAGRGLEFAYLSGEFGYQMVGLTAFSNKQLIADKHHASGGGMMFSVGAGVRVLYFTLGGRFRRSDLGDFGLWTLGSELGLRVPVGSFEPHAGLELGYAKVFGLEMVAPGLAASESTANIRGMNVRVGGGLDYYLSDSFSVGAQITGDLLFLKRAALGGEDVCDGADDCPYDQKGSSIGAAMTTSLVVGLHL